MSRYSGNLGFVMGQKESEDEPGVYIQDIQERKYYGEFYRVSKRNQQSSDTINGSYTIQNEISVISDAFLKDNLVKLKYIVFMGVRYWISNIQVSPPRLILDLGEVYNGPIPR